MKFIKKAVAISLVALTLTFMVSFSASALTTYIGDFGYQLDGTTYEATIVNYVGSAAEPVIPSNVYGYEVTKISSSVFSDNKAIKKIEIPSSVQTIGDYVFSNCTSLEEAIIPSSVTTLGKGIFSGCSALNKASINASVSVLPQSIFYNCTALSNVTLSDTISGYGNYAFYNCTSLKSMTIPRAVNSIADTAFSGADSVKIYCFKDSYAHTFAESKGISYVLFQTGDVNLDTRVDINDATAIQMYIAGLLNLSDDSLSLADVNGDNAILVTDATELQKALVGLVTL